MTGSYKRFDQIDPDLFRSMILGSRDEEPSQEQIGLMVPQQRPINVQPQPRPEGLGLRDIDVTPALEDTLLADVARNMGQNAVDRERVANAVVPAPQLPQEVDFSEWESMPPISDIIGPSQTEQAIPTLPSSMGITAPTQYVPANIDFTEGAEPISAPEISRVDDATFDRYTQATSAGSRELADIEGVVLHYTHGSPGGSSLDSYMNVGFNRGVGAPIFIARDGTIHEVGDWRNAIIQHTSRSGGIGTYRAPSGQRFSSANTVGIEIDVGWDWANNRPLEGEAGRPTDAQLEAVRRFTNSVINEVNAVRPDDLQLDINRSVYAHPELGRKMPTEGTYALQWLREQEGLPATRDVEWYMDNRGQERIRINRSLVPRPRPTGEGSSKQTTEKGESGKQTTAKDESFSMPENIRFDFIESQEGNRSSIYVPTGSDGSVLGNSGPTIGMGVDIGQASVESLEGLPQDLIDKLAPYTQMRGSDAQAYVQSNPLTLTDSELRQVNMWSKQRQTENLIRQWNRDSDIDWSDLTPQQATTVASVMYQYYRSNRVPSFWRAATSGDWNAVEKELRNFGDSYTSRRNREADLLTGN